MHPRAVTNWLKSRPLEAQEARDAEDEFTEQVEDKLAEAALAGEPWAINLWLKKRAPERWADRERVNVGGNVNVVALSSSSELGRMLTALGVGSGGTASDKEPLEIESGVVSIESVSDVHDNSTDS